jgi:hypothetical protein
LKHIGFFRKSDDEKLKHNEEEDGDPHSEPSLCLKLLSFFPHIIGLAEEPHYAAKSQCGLDEGLALSGCMFGADSDEHTEPPAEPDEQELASLTSRVTLFSLSPAQSASQAV